MASYPRHASSYGSLPMPQPGTRMRGGQLALSGRRRCTSWQMRPYDCDRSAAPSLLQSRTAFFSTYLHQLLFLLDAGTRSKPSNDC